MTIYKAELPKVEIDISFYKEILTEKLNQKLVVSSAHAFMHLPETVPFFPYYQGKIV